MELNLSQRYIHALQQLQQFAPYVTDDDELKAIHVLTGVQVKASSESDIDFRFITLQFPGSAPFEVVGYAYLQLQVCESAAHEVHSSYHVEPNPIAARADELMEHLCDKHELI